LEVSDDLKYCPHCGAKRVANADYCAKCGKRLTEKPVRSFILGTKLKKFLTISTSVLWVVISSLLISGLSIDRVDYDCSGGLFHRDDCQSRSVAEISIMQPGNLIVIGVTVVAIYALYKLWFCNKSISKIRIGLLMFATFVAIFYSVGLAFAGEQKNDRSILSSTERDCFNSRGLDYYINNRTYNCGPNVDSLMNMTFDEAFPDRNDSIVTVSVAWLLYTLFVCAVVLLPIKAGKQSGYMLKR
jgi:hypothetical protein